ncbi:MAG: HipA family kinase [Jatrophihabitans sp.]
MLPVVAATRYVTPLREGGSLPGLMEADDLGTYVVKFIGAGQGRKTLVAEVISAHLARALGLPVPDLSIVAVDPVLGTAEPDEEVQALLRASGGWNLGADYLPGSLDFTPGATVSAELAGRVIWFDAVVGNVDRSWRNPNMLLWHRDLYLIDHGATLTFHHNWAGAGFAAKPYDASEHALLGFAPDVAAADYALAGTVTAELIHAAVAEVPEVWLVDEPGFADVGALRTAYTDQLLARIEARPAWLPGVLATVAARPPKRTPTRTARPDWLHS